MKNKWFKLFLCVALVAVLCCVAALAEGETAAVSGATVTVNNDVTQFTQVKYNDASVVDANQYVLLIVKVDASNVEPASQGADVTAAEILAGATANNPTVTWDVGESTILYIDQKVGSEVKGDGFQSFAPKSFADAVILLGGTFSGEPAPTSPVVIGAIKGQGVTVSGEVTSYKPGVVTNIDLYDAEDSGYETSLYNASVNKADATEDDTAPETQTFEITGVAAGTYSVVVTKDGSLPYIITDVEVSADVELDEVILVSGNASPADDVVDEAVDGDDLLVLRGQWEKEGNEITNENADFDGSTAVDGNDLLILRNSWEKSTAADCTVAYTAPSNN